MLLCVCVHLRLLAGSFDQGLGRTRLGDRRAYFCMNYLTPCINKAYDDDDDDDDDGGFLRNSDNDMRTFRNCDVERFEI